MQLVESAKRVTASAFLLALIAAVPYKIHTILTDNGIPRYANGPTACYLSPQRPAIGLYARACPVSPTRRTGFSMARWKKTRYRPTW